MMDNEASAPLKHILQNRTTLAQLEVLYIHRRNAAERAIRTFKNIHMAELVLIYNNFMIYLWF